MKATNPQVVAIPDGTYQGTWSMQYLTMWLGSEQVRCIADRPNTDWPARVVVTVKAGEISFEIDQDDVLE